MFLFVINQDWIMTLDKFFSEDLPENVKAHVLDESLQIQKWEPMETWKNYTDIMSQEFVKDLPHCSMTVTINGSNIPMPKFY